MIYEIIIRLSIYSAIAIPEKLIDQKLNKIRSKYQLHHTYL